MGRTKERRLLLRALGACTKMAGELAPEGMRGTGEGETGDEDEEEDDEEEEEDFPGLRMRETPGSFPRDILRLCFAFAAFGSIGSGADDREVLSVSHLSDRSSPEY